MVGIYILHHLILFYSRSIAFILWLFNNPLSFTLRIQYFRVDGFIDISSFVKHLRFHTQHEPEINIEHHETACSRE